jgi:regulator of protease activity HflC (stomatin/prohibitin superfamily)
MITQERESRGFGGWGMLAVLVLVAGLIFWMFWSSFEAQAGPHRGAVTVNVPLVVAASILSLAWLVGWCGFFTLQPNEAGVLILFGKYKGTVKASGFWWVNPFINVKKISQRARNLNGDTIKVNDLRGNPIEIAVVVVWRVTDTARAVFDVDHFESYVSIQSESALRHLAMNYAYDNVDGGELTLRGSVDEVSLALQKELQERVGKAGVTVDEARISHLAYAPEIAGAMLRRQQAEAVVAARARLVDGAVGMVEMALAKLDEHQAIQLDDERRASMVSNLMVVLCGEREASPVINTGTLYS